MSPNYKIVLEYDGTHFYGWELQHNKRTVRGELEQALQKIFGERPKIYVASRTDSGVHALNQLANFKVGKSMDVNELRNALNGNLPHDIYIKSVEQVDADFNARYAPKRKIYLYRLLPGRSPLRRLYVWEYYKKGFDFYKVRDAATVFVGRYNFRNFAYKDEGICEVYRVEVTQVGDEIHFEIEGNRFLYKMVRMMVGSLVWVNEGKLTVDDIKNMLANKIDRKGFTAPPQGLYLKEVIFSL